MIRPLGQAGRRGRQRGGLVPQLPQTAQQLSGAGAELFGVGAQRLGLGEDGVGSLTEFRDPTGQFLRLLGDLRRQLLQSGQGIGSCGHDLRQRVAQLDDRLGHSQSHPREPTGGLQQGLSSLRVGLLQHAEGRFRSLLETLVQGIPDPLLVGLAEQLAGLGVLDRALPVRDQPLGELLQLRRRRCLTGGVPGQGGIEFVQLCVEGRELGTHILDGDVARPREVLFEGLLGLAQGRD